MKFFSPSNQSPSVHLFANRLLLFRGCKPEVSGGRGCSCLRRSQTLTPELATPGALELTRGKGSCCLHRRRATLPRDGDGYRDMGWGGDRGWELSGSRREVSRLILRGNEPGVREKFSLFFGKWTWNNNHFDCTPSLGLSTTNIVITNLTIRAYILPHSELWKSMVKNNSWWNRDIITMAKCFFFFFWGKTWNRTWLTWLLSLESNFRPWFSFPSLFYRVIDTRGSFNANNPCNPPGSRYVDYIPRTKLTLVKSLELALALLLPQAIIWGKVNSANKV